MENFSRVAGKYRDFSLVVKVPETVFGFRLGDEVVFREYSPDDRLVNGHILAVSKPMGSILEIGQLYFSASPIDGRLRQKIRLWNNGTGDLLRDFDIHGYMIRPSMPSWFARQELEGVKCCPREGDMGICRSPVFPCDAACPYLAQVGHSGPEERELEVYRRSWVCEHFAMGQVAGKAGGCRCGFRVGDGLCPIS